MNNKKLLFIGGCAVACVSIILGIVFGLQGHTKHLIAFFALAIIAIAVALVNRKQ